MSQKFTLRISSSAHTNTISSKLEEEVHSHPTGSSDEMRKHGRDDQQEARLGLNTSVRAAAASRTTPAHRDATK